MAEMTVRNFVIDSLHKFYVKILQTFNSLSPWKLGTGSSSVHLDGSLASGDYSVAEGWTTSAITAYSHAEGSGSIASGAASHAEGWGTSAITAYSHAEGAHTIANGGPSHAEGQNTIASGSTSHAEGYATSAIGNSSHAEGDGAIASGTSSHAEGCATSAIGTYSHAEGRDTYANGVYSHAEGYMTSATTQCTHAEGATTKASGNYSHAEGDGAIASGTSSHAEGKSAQAFGTYSHAEGYNTYASGSTSHAEGYGTIAANQYEHAQGIYNLSHSGSTTATKTIHSIGYGTSSAAANRKNLVEVMQNGDVYVQGVGGFTGANTGTTRTLQYTLSAKTQNYKIELYDVGWESLSNIKSALDTGKRVYVTGNDEVSPPYFPLSVSTIDEENIGIASFGGYNPLTGAMIGAYKGTVYADDDDTVDYETDSFRDNIFLHLITFNGGDDFSDGIYIHLSGNYYYFSTAITLNTTTIYITYNEPSSFGKLDQMAVLRFKTGSSPNITFIDNSLHASSIKFYDGAGSFQANTDYELNLLFNGYEIIISQAVLS